MRPSQKNNRSRGKNVRKSNGPSVNRVYDSSGPEGKVRGTPQQIIEKYQSLARDRATAGDHILAENFLQHAEHYVRLLMAAQAAAPAPRREEEPEAEAQNPADGPDALAVIDGEPGEKSSPEEMNSGRRPGRRDDDGEGDEGGRRRQRRSPRRGKPAAGVQDGDEAAPAPQPEIREADAQPSLLDEAVAEAPAPEGGGLEADPRRDPPSVDSGPEWIEGVAPAKAS